MGRNRQLYRLRPIVLHRVWGGGKLARKFQLQPESGCPGEIVAAAGFRERDTVVEELEIPLSQLYEQEPELFGVSCRCFPITVNLIDAVQDLSVQVHPDRFTSERYGEPPGAPEAWVVLDCDAGSRIVVGHRAGSTRELAEAVDQNQWNGLLRSLPGTVGDFYLLPVGTVHAIGAGMQIYELTQASETVYRLYDYGRNSKSRPLDTKKALQTIGAPQQIDTTQLDWSIRQAQLSVTQYVDEPDLFSLIRLDLRGEASWQQERFGLLTVVQGGGTVGDRQVRAGETLLIPHRYGPLSLRGNFTAMLASYREGAGGKKRESIIRHAANAAEPRDITAELKIGKE